MLLKTSGIFLVTNDNNFLYSVSIFIAIYMCVCVCVCVCVNITNLDPEHQ